MKAIMFIFLLLNLFVLISQLGQPLYRADFNLLIGSITGIAYTLAIITALVEITTLKKLIKGDKNE
jgi:hypothetical protein